MAYRSAGRLSAKHVVALVAVVAALVAFAGPSQAEAGVSNYCNNQNLQGYEVCEGAMRQAYAVQGWGDQHAVCVFFRFNSGWGGTGHTCSSGPAPAAAYSTLYQSYPIYPTINNHAAGWNIVHGRAFQP